MQILSKFYHNKHLKHTVLSHLPKFIEFYLCIQNDTIKNVSWPHFSWPTLYSASRQKVAARKSNECVSPTHTSSTFWLTAMQAIAGIRPELKSVVVKWDQNDYCTAALRLMNESKSSSLKLFAIFLPRLRIFPWNFCQFVAQVISTYIY